MNIYYYSEDLIMNLGMVLFFFVFAMLLLVFITFLKSLTIKKEKKKFQPGISVLIPAYNEESIIRRTLRTVLKSNYDNFEVILIDDGSTDKTIKIAEKFNIKIINGKHNGKSEALNLGMKFAKFDFIVTLDADTLVNKNFLKEIINPFYDYSVGATNGMAFVNPSRIIRQNSWYIKFCSRCTCKLQGLWISAHGSWLNLRLFNFKFRSMNPCPIPFSNHFYIRKSCSRSIRN